ncbi:hypothetical protein [Chitinophaga cymbidii]|uniref:Uncharacterized protein n=1 Tax=Chitinophaga cymbidii TaxID=1096750 RepID=A0A512RQN5_9BACT|nr:hypothetical protein [Chitinophaga cymbidii]GEP98006.1 hypothetical protein CCY01nite_42660 [Chitinophaga cymbidii]
MRKTLAYIFLALYLNTAMFLPVTGHNAHRAGERIIDHINSGVEFLVQTVMGCKDTSPDDREEKNNSSRFLSQSGMQVYLVTPEIQLEQQPDGNQKIIYPPGIDQKPYSMPLDILSPPPDAA